MSTERKKPGFSVAIPTDPLAHIAQQLFDLRVELGTLAVLVMDASVAAGKDPEEIAQRYKTTRERLALELAFEFQDKAPETP